MEGSPMEKERGSTWAEYKLPCPKCGGSDPVARNLNGTAKCFSCGEWFTDYASTMDSSSNGISKKDFVVEKEPTSFLNSYTGVFAELTDRGISEKVARKYGVRIVYDAQGKIAKHIYPFYNNNEIVGTKTRLVSEGKDFRFNGTYENTGLFGEQLFRNGGKHLTICEGECDAMAAHEMMDSKWAVVSIKRGAQSAVRDIRDSIEFVEAFENVVLCFDNDQAGRKAAREVANIIKPGKVKIMSLPNGHKDPNAMLQQAKFAEFNRAWWDAKKYTPAGILELSNEKSKWLHREEKESLAYPWEGLNKKLFGMRKGELVTLTGGTGLGKSSFTRELSHYLIKNTTENVGIIALEENWLRTADGILSIEANDRLYLTERRENYSDEELSELFDKVIQKGRVFIHSHLGATNIDEIFSKLRYMIVGCECEWVIVDHLHMLVNCLTESDERRGIDQLMQRLRSLVEETGVGMFLVSHLRRALGDRGHEQGVVVSLSHLKGSQGISQLSDCVIALERNQQAEDPVEANTTKVRVLKSRYTGDTGLACLLKYDKDTGRMHELTDDLTFYNEDF